MSQTQIESGLESYRRKRRLEGVFGALSAGVFLLLIGGIVVATPNLIDAIRDFSLDFRSVEVSPNFSLPAPRSNYPRVYTAVEQFCLAYGFFQVIILVLRLGARSPTDGIARNIQSIVFWLGAGLITSRLLIEPTGLTISERWFVFWSAIIMLTGLSLIVRGIILAATPRTYTVQH